MLMALKQTISDSDKLEDSRVPVINVRHNRRVLTWFLEYLLCLSLVSELLKYSWVDPYIYASLSQGK